MDVIKLSTDWAKAEILSARLMLLFSLLVFLLAVGFWQVGKTGMAKAFIIPLFVMGILIFSVGVGLYLANKPRVKQFPIDCLKNREAFINMELARTAKSQQDFSLVFKVLPAIIIVAALLIIFIPANTWRASSVGIILLMGFLMLVDAQTEARNSAYHQALINVRP